MPDDPDADLYGDLESALPAEGEALLKAQLAELSAKVEEQDQELLALRAQVASLQSEKESHAKDKETLTRNISSLFKTAQMEVQRKVEEIKQLRQR